MIDFFVYYLVWLLSGSFVILYNEWIIIIIEGCYGVKVIISCDCCECCGC